MSKSFLLLSLCVLMSQIRGDISNLRGVFDKIKQQSRSVYTPDEDSQHFSRFKNELEEKILHEDVSIEYLTESFNNTKPALLQSMVDKINSMQQSWTASKDQPPFKGMSIKDLPAGCSNDTMFSSTLDEGGENRLLGPTNPVLTTLPSSFDARQKFASCADVIGHVREQGECNNCWASAAVGMFNDRVCIKSGGRITDILSLGYLTSCCNRANGCPKSNGCMFGSVPEGLNFMKNHGLVTGGEYKPPEELGNDDGCWPYPFPKCNHVPGLESKYPRCAQVRDLPACATTCPNKAYGTSMQKDTHRAKSWGRLPIGPEKIKQEIFDNGPVAAMMTLYEDFRFYKSGVYVHKTGQMLAAHTLKLIGWGVESGQEYWLAVNAWNEEWGDHGMIKLAVGKTGLEHQVYRIEADV